MRKTPRPLGGLFWLLVPLVLGPVVALSLAAAPAPGGQQESWTQSYPLPAGSEVEVTNVQGSIEVEGWDRPEVELIVTKSAEDAEASLGDVAVVVAPGPNSLRVRTLYRSESDLPVQVDYRLRVPRQLRLGRLRTVNGDIVVRTLEGWVEAHTLNGNIVQTGVAGSVLARAVNGSVSLSLRALPEPGGQLTLETINGDLLLALPVEADADLDVSTVAGKIQSPFLQVARVAGDPTALRTRLGRGGVSVRLRTIRGSIQILNSQGGCEGARSSGADFLSDKEREP